MEKNHEPGTVFSRRPRKHLDIMRLTGFLCLLGFMPLSARTYSQEYNISLKMENATVQEVFDEITKATGLDFFYNSALVDASRRVSVTLSGASIEGVLNAVFKGYRARFEVNERFIVLLDLRPEEREPQRRGTLVHGTITDVNGDPLPGVTVRVKGTSAGVASEANGHYAIPVPLDGRPVLQFSFIGMKAKEVHWQGEKVIDVTMEEEVQEMNEVVVLGIANVTRRDMVGSFTQLPVDAVMQPIYNSVDQMLEGRVAGLAVTTTSLRAGAAPSITIRGRSTLLGNTQPLWVVDGIVQNEVIEVDALSGLWGSSSGEDLSQYLGSQISWLNPDDIETITVLKDATATAIYGSRASNGVIVITTRKGSADRLSVNLSSNWNVRFRPTYRNYDLMNSQQRVRFSREAFDAGVLYLNVPLAQPYTYEGLLRLFNEGLLKEDAFREQYELLETVNTDWLDLLARDAIGQRHNMSINGGTAKSTYSFSASYDKTEGIEKGNMNERVTARLAVGMALSPDVHLDVAINGGFSTTTGFAAGVNPLAYATTTSRAIPVRHPDGSLLFHKVNEAYHYNDDTKATGLDFNILHEMANTGARFRNPRASVNVNFKWELLPALAYELAAGVKLESRKGEIWADAPSMYVARRYRGYPVGTVDPGSAYYKAALLPFGGELQTEDSFGLGYELRNTLKFNKTFREDHRVVAQAGWEIRSNLRDSKVNTVWGFDRDRGERITPPAVPSTIVPVGAASAPRDLGIFDELYSGRWLSTNFTNNHASLIFIGSYALKNRYILNANMRNDWSNRFGQNINRRFDPTYSLGVAWRAADEPWLEARWLTQLSPRISYGIQGNVLNSVSPEMILRKGPASTLYNGYTAGIVQLANPTLSWERTRIWNFGLDLGLFNNRVSLVVDGYTRDSNVGISYNLSPEYGGYATPVTGTHVRNTGLEATLNTRLLAGKEWQLTVGANAAKNWNKIVKTGFLDSSPRTTANYINGQGSRVLEPGYAYGAFWAYAFDALDANGYPTFKNLDLAPGAPFTDFLVLAGTRVPLVNGGAHLRLSYKNLALYTLFSVSLGGKEFLPNPYDTFSYGLIPSPTANLPAELTRRWKKPGDVTDIPGLYTGGEAPLFLADPSELDGSSTADRYLMWGHSDARVASTSTLKCKVLQLTWSGRPACLAALGVKSVSVNASVNNLFLLANERWNGMDPALGGRYIEPRSFNAGLNIGF
ncbi:MAG: SusC/RagA family TonB-linked outer membrane protein [Odoribacteraceae bacterium]|jgi:TonB-linked SusC/RagA family outer membrane protein|nr:SusC/RagA family TonB-linked outer membrane protein [Odoribacteraceae bacterium]